MTYFFEIGKIQNHIIKSTKKLTKNQVKSLSLTRFQKDY